MKKNIVGHMMASKEPVAAKLRRWCIFPRILCFLLALLIWLTIVNLDTRKEDAPATDSGETVQI